MDANDMYVKNEAIASHEDTANGDANGAGYVKSAGYALSPEAEEYVQRLETEAKYLGENYPCLRGVAEREVARVRTGEISEKGSVVIHKDQPIKFVRRVLIPFKEHPEVNFVGRLLGPKGATLKALQQQTRARILIFGRGSMRDQAKEEEMRTGGDPRYVHLKEDLHVYVEIYAYPVEAQGRFANVLAELKKFLDPSHPNPQPGMMGPRAPMGGMRPPPPQYRPRAPYPPQQRYPPPQRPQAPPVQPAESAYNSYYAQAPQAAAPAAYPASQGYNEGGYAQYPSGQASGYAMGASSYDPAEQSAAAAQYAAGGYAAQAQQPAYATPTTYSAPGVSYAQAPAYANWPEGAPGTNGQQTNPAPPPQWTPPAKKPRLAAPYAPPTSY